MALVKPVHDRQTTLMVHNLEVCTLFERFAFIQTNTDIHFKRKGETIEV
jgi:hypothetical protein